MYDNLSLSARHTRQVRLHLSDSIREVDLWVCLCGMFDCYFEAWQNVSGRQRSCVRNGQFCKASLNSAKESLLICSSELIFHAVNRGVRRLKQGFVFHHMDISETPVDVPSYQTLLNLNLEDPTAFHCQQESELWRDGALAYLLLQDGPAVCLSTFLHNGQQSFREGMAFYQDSHSFNLFSHLSGCPQYALKTLLTWCQQLVDLKLGKIRYVAHISISVLVGVLVKTGVSRSENSNIGSLNTLYLRKTLHRQFCKGLLQ